jgi:hypothetical protein
MRKEIKKDDYEEKYTDLTPFAVDLNPETKEEKGYITNGYKLPKVNKQDIKQAIKLKIRVFRNKTTKPFKNVNNFFNNEKVTSRFMIFTTILAVGLIAGTYYTISILTGNPVEVNIDQYKAPVYSEQPLMSERTVNYNPIPQAKAQPVVTTIKPTVKPTVEIIVTPVPYANTQTVNQFNYVSVKGLNSSYIMPKTTQSYKKGQTINFDMILQNLYEQDISKIDATITINTYTFNKADNQPSITPIYTNNLVVAKDLKLKQYDTYSYTQRYTIPNFINSGEYMIIINLKGDNYSNCKIQQIIRVI